MELYWGSGSMFAWRVMLGLMFKGMSYDDHLLSFSDREHKSPAFLALNPRGKVPTLVDGETVVTESIAILAYLDRVHPRQPLFGTSTAEGGRIWSRVLGIENHLYVPGNKVIQSLFRGRMLDTVEGLADDVREIRRELDTLETAPETGPFNAVDAMLVPLIESLVRASRKQGGLEIGLLPFDIGHWPRLAERHEAIKALEGYRRTTPPHWS